MRVGKISESILKRSVLKQLHSKVKDVQIGSGVGVDYGTVKLEADELLVLSCNPVTLPATEGGMLGIHRSLNDLAVSGALPVGILLTILLPVNTEEGVLRHIMQMAEVVCSRADIEIIGGHTEVSKLVNAPIVTVTALGKMSEKRQHSAMGVKPGMDIIMTKWAGLEGTFLLAQEKSLELSMRFTSDFLEKAIGYKEMLSVYKEAAVAVRSGVSAMHNTSEGGVFAGLWEMAEASGVGLDIELKSIPLKQETVEICEYLEINPYELIAGGGMLLAANDGNYLVSELQKEGISATIIGKATDSNDRVLYNDGERRFLEPPKSDQLYQVI